MVNEDLTIRILRIISKNVQERVKPVTLTKTTGASSGNLSYALDKLEREKIISCQRAGKYRRYVSLNKNSAATKKVLAGLGIQLGRRRAEKVPVTKEHLYHYKATVKKVVDGDTVDMLVDLGFFSLTKQRFRLAKVNAPEIFRVKKDSESYKAGIKTKNFLVKWIEGREVYVTSKRTGKWGRWLAEIWADGVSVNDTLISRGLAKAY